MDRDQVVVYLCRGLVDSNRAASRGLPRGRSASVAGGSGSTVEANRKFYLGPNNRLLLNQLNPLFFTFLQIYSRQHEGGDSKTTYWGCRLWEPQGSNLARHEGEGGFHKGGGFEIYAGIGA